MASQTLFICSALLVICISVGTEGCYLTGGKCVKMGVKCGDGFMPGNFLTTCFTSTKYCCVPTQNSIVSNPLGWVSAFGVGPEEEEVPPESEEEEATPPPAPKKKKVAAKDKTVATKKKVAPPPEPEMEEDLD